MKLELFKSTVCPYCRVVLNEIRKSGRTDVVVHNIDEDEEQKTRLVQVGGMMQVPCLFIDGKPLYESGDIVKWLIANPQQ